MSDYLTLQRSLIKKTLVFALAAACICLAFNHKAAAKGIALGSIFSVADFKLMAFLLPRRLVGQRRGGVYFGLICRFVLLSIPLILAIKLPSINFAATVVGLLLVKAAVFYHFFLSKRSTPSAGPSRGNSSSQNNFDNPGCGASSAIVEQKRS
ncbi:MAG: ATP synthase subunit I [Deltaproteobacteria bacterium]|nr:MAG: ATP synthase subunit I [Deltaproteobacteria bacterium]